MKNFKYVSCVAMLVCMLSVSCMYLGGGGTLFYIDSAQAETVNQTQETQAESSSFIGKIFDYFMIVVNFVLNVFYYVWLAMQWVFWAFVGIIQWLIKTFGKGAEYILGFLGFTTITALLGNIFSKIITETLASRGKKIAEKAWDQYFAEKKESEPKEERKRDLTKNEIIGVTMRYGYVLGGDKNGVNVPDEDEVYTSWIYAGITWYGVTFCKNGVYTYSGLFSTRYEALSYDELRNSPEITMSYLKLKFEGFPDEFFSILMELKEID